MRTASIIMAAGRGSRMIGYNGNKTLLPLQPRGAIYRGESPILIHILFMETQPGGVSYRQFRVRDPQENRQHRVVQAHARGGYRR